MGPRPSEHLLRGLHPGQPRQEVQPDRPADDGETQVRHLPVPGPGHVPLPRRRRLHRSDPDDARLLPVHRIPVPGAGESVDVLL